MDDDSRFEMIRDSMSRRPRPKNKNLAYFFSFFFLFFLLKVFFPFEDVCLSVAVSERM